MPKCSNVIINCIDFRYQSHLQKYIEDKSMENDVDVINIVGGAAKLDDYKKYTIDNNLQIVDLMEEENMQTGEVKYYYIHESIKYEYLPLYKDEKENVIILPISGKGLWSTLFGYFAIDSNDYSTVKGITFYKHKETPGLGGEVEAGWFKKQFIDNKKIYNINNELSSITVTKAGKVTPGDPHQVDGISGATITSKGVSDFLLRDLKRYQHYFESNK